MSSESSAAKWLVGCLIAGVVGVLLCGGAIGLIGFWGYGVARQVAQEVGPELVSMGELLHEAQTWNPPSAEAGPDDVFPLTVTPTRRPRPGQPLPRIIPAWTRISHDDSAAIPELALDQDGRRARYEADGAAIDVSIYQVPFSEQAQVFSDAVSAIQGAGYSSQTHHDYKFDEFEMVRWMTFSFSPPERHGRMLWVKDWLIVTMTDKGGVDLEGFEHAYLLGIQGIGAPAASNQDSLSEPVPESAVPAEESAPAEPVLEAPAEPEPAADAAETPPDNPDAVPESPDATAPAESPRG